MKTITIEYDLYHQEHSSKYKEGIDTGIWEVYRFIQEGFENRNHPFRLREGHWAPQIVKMLDLLYADAKQPKEKPVE